MAIKNTKKQADKATEKKQEELVVSSLKVDRVKEIKDKEGCYRFNMELNGIWINGCKYISYTDKQGKEANFVALPNYKGTDGKYYNIVYFPISDDLFKKIEALIEKAVNTEEEELPF